MEIVGGGFSTVPQNEEQEHEQEQEQHCLNHGVFINTSDVILFIQTKKWITHISQRMRHTHNNILRKMIFYTHFSFAPKQLFKCWITL